MTRHVLLTGGSGQLGLALRARAWPEDVTLHAPARAELDLSDIGAIESCFAARRWAAVINAGAYTAVDAAETDVAACWQANARAPGALAALAARQGAAMIHISTGYVFDGAKAGDYVESDAIGPLSAYGASKAAGELAVAAAHPRAVILRTSWLISPHGRNFLAAIFARARAGERLRVVDDQYGNPSTAQDVAAIVAAIGVAHLDDENAPAGLFHCVNEGVASWREFAAAIVAMAPDLSHRPEVEAISTADYPAKARRPANCALSTRRLADAFGLAPRPWREAVAETMQALAAPA